MQFKQKKYRYYNTFALILFVILSNFFSVNSYAQNIVNIYSSRQEVFIEPLLSVFTQMTGISANVQYIKKGAVSKLFEEGSNATADILLVNEFNQLIEAKKLGITQPVDSKELRDRIDGRYRDSAGHWFGLSKRARIIVASNNRVIKDDLTYDDLASEEWKGRVCIRSANHPYNVGLISSMIAHKGGEWVENWLYGLKQNLVAKPEGGDRDQVKRIYDGECDIAVINSYYMGAMIRNTKNPEQRNWAYSVKTIFPNTKDRGTHINITGMSLIKYAPNRDNAVLLMDFLTSKPAQYIYAIENHEYPIRNDVKISEIVESWGALSSDEITLEELSAQTSNALKLIKKLQFDVGPQG